MALRLFDLPAFPKRQCPPSGYRLGRSAHLCSMHGMSHTSIPSRIARYFRARSPRYLAGLIAVALSVVVLCLPSAYSVEMPGPTQNVLGSSDGKQIIAVSQAHTYRSRGKLLLTTVNASGLPGYPVTNAEVVWALFDPHAVVMPREVVVPTGQTAEEDEAESATEMKDSQNSAVKAAKNMLRKRGIDVADAQVSMHVDDIGGPSAGMMYTLGLIDKLTSQDETGGKTIAGTGTINAKGTVGENRRHQIEDAWSQTRRGHMVFGSPRQLRRSGRPRSQRVARCGCFHHRRCL